MTIPVGTVEVRGIVHYRFLAPGPEFESITGCGRPGSPQGTQGSPVRFNVYPFSAERVTCTDCISGIDGHGDWPTK